MTTFLAPLFRLLLLLAVICAPAARAADDFLDPEQAFTVAVKPLDDHRIALDYTIAKGYYLYRERFHFEPAPGATGVTLGTPEFPKGEVHYDPNFEKNVETYHLQVHVVLPVSAGPAAFDLVATHQGCAEKGLCYPPQPRTIHVELKGLGAAANAVTLVAAASDATGGSPGATSTASSTPAVTSARDGFLAGNTAPASAPAATTAPAPASAGDDEGLGATLRGGHLWVLLPLAFVVGLGLSFTPCVLPMLPILSAIIVGQSQTVTRGRGLALAASYSLGMALVYTALGVAAGLAGEGLAAYLQKPAVLLTFGGLLALLSLSMFGLYELQLPEALRDRLNARNANLTGGQLGGVFAMGVLSALIVSPCVSAPLGGVLLFIAQTRDAVLGGLGLFAIAAGMSVPLLLVGASAGTLLPRSGAWMNRVKMVFGLLLLAVAIYIVSPAVPTALSMGAWALLGVLGGTAMGAFEPASSGPHAGASRLFRGVALVMAVAGLLEVVGLASGARDPMQPLGRLAAGASAGGQPAADAPAFDRVKSVAQLDDRLKSAGKPVLLDFYADWCVSCKEMESQTFSDPAVKAVMAKAVLLRADVTANDGDDRALLKRFGLFGPPGIIVFDAQGHEVAASRVVGFQAPARFLQSLSGAGL